MAEAILQESCVMKHHVGNLFKSVNLRLDIDYPDRFAHFFPTSKSANVINAVVQGKPEPASIVVASYGSGKSLAAGTAALLVENSRKAKKQLKAMASRLASIDGQLGKFATNRIGNGVHGLSILLEGSQEELPRSLLEQSSRRLKCLREKKNTSADLLGTLKAISELAYKQNIDCISIIWDEFGRHLETLAAKGNAEGLLAVQQLAEWVSRQSNPRMTLTLLLHQNFSQYANSLNQTARIGWRKIEGRFSSISYVEDSDEMYDLIASVVADQHPPGKLPSAKEFKDMAKKAVAAGFFKSYSSKTRLQKVLANAYPLTPAALDMLPKLAARIAQNERTIFTYLQSADLSSRQSLETLYHYFSSSMEADTGLGGTYRRWIETQSALSKVSAPIDKEVLASLAVLGLGISGERQRVGKEAISFAVAGDAVRNKKAVEKSIETLTKKKLLLHSKHNDNISVWHGTDIDIRARLEAEMAKIDNQVDVMAFLEKEHPAPSWRPVEHNVKWSVRRFYRGRFVNAHELAVMGKEHSALRIDAKEDGAVIYCLAEDSREIKDAKNATPKCKDCGGRVVIAIPNEPLQITEVVTEITALRNIQLDREFIATDPFAESELQHMVDVAQETFARTIQRLVQPRGDSTSWYAKGKKLQKLSSPHALRSKLSEFAEEEYRSTPRINNELIVRHAVSRQMVNARKKLVLGILERSGQEHLGFDLNATTPFVALYRTVLHSTGLYINKKGKGTWAKPAVLRAENPGLAALWEKLEDFFSLPGKGKKPEDLISILVSPPFGTRIGLMPILMAAGMQAFSRAIAIRKNNVYLLDVLASQIEELCSSEGVFSIDVLQIDSKKDNYLRQLIELFGEIASDGDLLRQLYDSIVRWKSRLPEQALVSRSFGKRTRSMQRAIRDSIDPLVLAFEKFPEIAGCAETGNRTIEKITSSIQELEGLVDKYAATAINEIGGLLTISPDGPDGVLQRAHDWASCFKGSKSVAKLGSTHKAILTRSLEATSGRFTEASFARALSAILLGRDFEKWDDSSARTFANSLRSCVNEIEQEAFMGRYLDASLAPLLERRIEHYKEALGRIKTGKEKSSKTGVTSRKSKASRSQRVAEDSI